VTESYGLCTGFQCCLKSVRRFSKPEELLALQHNSHAVGRYP